MVGGLVLGAALGGPLPHVEATLLSALTGAIVAAAGSTGPSRIARRLAVVAAGSSLVLMVVAFATGNHAVWAALAMAAVALVTSLAAGIGPLGAVLGYLLSLAYLLVAGLSRVADLVEVVSLPWAAAHIAAGCVAGLIVVFVATSWRRRSEPDEVRAATVSLPLRPMWESLRRFDEHARDGVRRAIPLAVLMFFFQRDAGRDAFWIFFAAFIVLVTPGKAPRSVALVRAGGTVFGVVLLALASVVVPDRALFSLGFLAILAGIGISPPYPIVGGGLTTVGSILLAGEPTGEIALWAQHRLLDILLGCAIALAATYLLWPRDRSAETTVPVPT